MTEKNLVPHTETQLQHVEEAAERATHLPTTDIRETPEAFVLVADLPGVDETALDISLEKGLLTIYGRRSLPAPEEGYALRWGESRDADLRRTFRIPEEIDADGIDAVLTQGVLTLTLPKSQAISRRISIRTAS